MKNNRKAWVFFILVLIISAQFLVLSLFHTADDNGYVFGNSVVSVVKWNYVSASIVISILPSVLNGSAVSPVELVFPNGTTYSITHSSSSSSPQSWYSFRVQLPMTGISLGNGATSGPIALSQDHPLNVTISQNVQNVNDYVAFLQSSADAAFVGSDLQVQVYVLIIRGEAQVAVSGYGVAL